MFPSLLSSCCHPSYSNAVWVRRERNTVRTKDPAFNFRRSKAKVTEKLSWHQILVFSLDFLILTLMTWKTFSFLFLKIDKIKIRHQNTFSFLEDAPILSLLLMCCHVSFSLILHYRCVVKMKPGVTGTETKPQNQRETETLFVWIAATSSGLWIFCNLLCGFHIAVIVMTQIIFTAGCV